MIESDNLFNGQKLGNAVNSFINQGGYRALRCDKHQFWAKMTVITVVDYSGLNKKEGIRKMALLLPHTFLFSCLS